MEILDSPAETPRKRQRRQQSSTAPLVIGAEPGLDGSASAADAAKPAAKKKYAAATPQELAGMLSFGVRGVSVLVAAWLEIEDLAMWPVEADAIARPLGNLLWRSEEHTSELQSPVH